MKIIKIGVTGSAGSGKSLVCGIFKDLGLVTLDCDQIARQVTEPGQKAYTKILELFGRDMVLEDKRLDRPRLRNIMVARPDLRKGLEALLHPIILDELFSQMEAAQYPREPACAAEVPLLFELGLEHLFDAVVTVAGDEGDLTARIARRDGVSRADAAGILELQMTQSEKIRRSDYVVENRGTPEELKNLVKKVYQSIKKEFLTKNK
ncbi:dephospho-CoA kinase [Desulfospira joergensenii]|uniref:dephospho-CoA kinase n=1 Tax=Desulfospira joergensenii TaxID=53329 RepID=UPI001FC949FB|nr:dephospho-CoA kinase [Desulfospira joergensenii]